MAFDLIFAFMAMVTAAVFVDRYLRLRGWVWLAFAFVLVLLAIGLTFRYVVTHVDYVLKEQPEVMET